jgi:hypothetical protein
MRDAERAEYVSQIYTITRRYMEVEDELVVARREIMELKEQLRAARRMMDSERD